MIEEFIKEYRQLRKEYEDKHGELWMCNAMENLVNRYETELNIQSLKELQKPFDPAVNDSIKDMEEEERASLQIRNKKMEYKLKKDLPFAKVGDGNKLIMSDKDCFLTDKDGWNHPLCFGQELFKDGVQRLLNEGWVEEVKPREWYEIIYKDQHYRVSDHPAFNDLETAQEEAKHCSKDLEVIKVREVIE